MKTVKYIKDQIKAIMDKTDLEPELLEPLKSISEAVDEYGTELQKIGEPWDNEAEDFDFKAKVPAADTSKADEWEGKYKALKERYTEAFLYGAKPDGNAGNDATPPADDIDPNEPEEPTIDSLFVEAE